VENKKGCNTLVNLTKMVKLNTSSFVGHKERQKKRRDILYRIKQGRETWVSN
jgi:hypothetical protein